MQRYRQHSRPIDLIVLSDLKSSQIFELLVMDENTIELSHRQTKTLVFSHSLEFDCQIMDQFLPETASKSL